MKQIIKCKVFNAECTPQMNYNGEFIDLRAAEDIHLKAPYANTLHKNKGDKIRSVEFDTVLIPLGVAMQLPAGMEAIVVPRSSTFAKFGIIQANSMGVIDNSYCGDSDQWFFPAIALKECNINKGDRICQFKIQPSQKASVWQKLKWLITEPVIEFVDVLYNNDRGGHGSTGVK